MIANVTVYLDDNRLECMDAAIRCGYIVAEDESGEETFHHDLLDSSGYWSLHDLVNEVAAILRVNRGAVLVAG